MQKRVCVLSVCVILCVVKYEFHGSQIALVNNLLKLGINELKLRFRERLTKYLYDQYLQWVTLGTQVSLGPLTLVFGAQSGLGSNPGFYGLCPLCEESLVSCCSHRGVYTYTGASTGATRTTRWATWTTGSPTRTSCWRRTWRSSATAWWTSTPTSAR